MEKIAEKWERIMGFTLNINPGFALLSVLILSPLRFKRLKKVKWDKINLYLWAGLFVSGIISVLNAYDTNLAVTSFLIPFIFIWLYIMGKYFIDKPIVFLKDVIRGTVILAIVTILANYFSWRIIYKGFEIINGRGRANILGIGDNGLGVIIQVGIIGSLGFLFIVKRKKEKLIYLLYIILSLGALIISSSRGAMVGTAAGSFILTLLLSWKVIVVLTSLVAVALFSYNRFYRRALSIFSLEDRSNFMRIKIYEGTWKLLKDHLFFGVGPGNFETVYPQYRVPGETLHAITPHNNYFNIITGWGIIGGFLFFGWIFYTILKHLWDITNDNKKIIIAILLGFWVHVIFNDLATAYSAVLMGLLDNENLK